MLNPLLQVGSDSRESLPGEWVFALVNALSVVHNPLSLSFPEPQPWEPTRVEIIPSVSNLKHKTTGPTRDWCPSQGFLWKLVHIWPPAVQQDPSSRSCPCAASATGQLTSAPVGVSVYICSSQTVSVDCSLSSLCPGEVIFILLSLPSFLHRSVSL